MTALTEPIVEGEGLDAYLDHVEQELVRLEVEVGLQEAATRTYAEDDRIDGLPPTIISHFENPHGTIVGEGSEAELRGDEAVCPVTNLTYYAALGSSPYLEDTAYPLARLGLVSVID